MASTNHQDLAGVIWKIANKLRGPYRPPQYRHVMLPMTILRRLDLVLEPTKESVLAELKRLKAKGMSGPALEAALSRVANGGNRKQALSNPPFGVEWKPEKSYVDDEAAQGFVGQVVANSVGVSYPAINATEILQLPEVIPPYDEQQAIAEHIDKKTATIDRQKAQVTEAIERLKEYRTALITDAVTGKMNVHSHGKKESLSA